MKRTAYAFPNWTNFIYDPSDKARDPFLKLRSFCSCGRGGHSSKRTLWKNCLCKRGGMNVGKSVDVMENVGCSMTPGMHTGPIYTNRRQRTQNDASVLRHDKL